MKKRLLLASGIFSIFLSQVALAHPLSVVCLDNKSKHPIISLTINEDENGKFAYGRFSPLFFMSLRAEFSDFIFSERTFNVNNVQVVLLSCISPKKNEFLRCESNSKDTGITPIITIGIERSFPWGEKYEATIGNIQGIFTEEDDNKYKFKMKVNLYNYKFAQFFANGLLNSWFSPLDCTVKDEN